VKRKKGKGEKALKQEGGTNWKEDGPDGHGTDGI